MSENVSEPVQTPTPGIPLPDGTTELPQPAEGASLTAPVMQPTDTPIDGGSTVTGTSEQPVVTSVETTPTESSTPDLSQIGGEVADARKQATAVLMAAGHEAPEVEDILSTLEKSGLTIATAEQVAGDVGKVVTDIKADPQVVEQAKSALADFGHAAQDVEEFVAHLFHRGFNIVHTGQGKVEAPSA